MRFRPNGERQAIQFVSRGSCEAGEVGGGGHHARGLLQGTSGNLSAVVNRQPLQLAITPSGADKGQLSSSQILAIDQSCRILNGASGKPSDESPLHVTVVKARDAGAVIHTHSVWATILSDLDLNEGGLAIEGYEMLKGLHGVTTRAFSKRLAF